MARPKASRSDQPGPLSFTATTVAATAEAPLGTPHPAVLPPSAENPLDPDTWRGRVAPTVSLPGHAGVGDPTRGDGGVLRLGEAGRRGRRLDRAGPPAGWVPAAQALLATSTRSNGTAAPTPILVLSRMSGRSLSHGAAWQPPC